MKKATIYTSENCGYCTTIKDKFKENDLEFIEKERSEYINEWNIVSRLTGVPSFPTIEFNGDYYVPGRDYNAPEQIINHIKNWDENAELSVSNDVKLLEAFKTLTFTLNRSFSGLRQELQQIKTKLDGNESNN